MQTFNHNSVASLPFQSICTVQYVISLAAPNQFSACVWCHAVYFSNTVCQTFCAILTIFAYVCYSFYQFSAVYNTTYG